MEDSITSYLHNKGFHTFEGYSQQVPEQVKDLIELTKSPHISVMEIGFNAGHSAEVFLKYNSTLTLTSFDLGEHDYVPVAKEYVDMRYSGRHTLFLGDSTITVPEFKEKNPDVKFDIIFIDGGHDYPIAHADLENCRKLAHKDTIVIMDDTCYTRGWGASYTIGPTHAWLSHINNRVVKEIHHNDYAPGRGMSWGKYSIE
jgi:predicted O-methyltransferase YrrM